MVKTTLFNIYIAFVNSKNYNTQVWSLQFKKKEIKITFIKLNSISPSYSNYWSSSDTSKYLIKTFNKIVKYY